VIYKYPPTSTSLEEANLKKFKSLIPNTLPLPPLIYILPHFTQRIILVGIPLPHRNCLWICIILFHTLLGILRKELKKIGIEANTKLIRITLPSTNYESVMKSNSPRCIFKVFSLNFLHSFLHFILYNKWFNLLGKKMWVLYKILLSSVW